jgi:cell division protein FtsI (penicillin-binding protein 3)
MPPMSSPSKIKPQGQRFRFFLVKGSVMFAFALLAARLVWVQGVLRAELLNRAERRSGKTVTLAGYRHRILDRNASPMAENVQVYSCFADPSLIKDRAGTARMLASSLGMDERTIRAKLASRKSFVWIRRNVAPATALALKDRKLPGVAFRLEMRRHYPAGPVASHLLGMVGVDGAGLSGIEQAFDNVLNPKRGPASIPPGHVRLSIDANIQRIVERELDWGARKTGAKRGMTLIQDPNTGEILAMAAWPPMSLEPERPPKSGEMRVPPLVDTFEPGSTFKIVVGAAAVEEKLVQPGELFSGENGKWKVYDRTIHDHEARKLMTFEDILVYSSNIGTAKIAERLGAAKLYQYARLFGFGVFPGSCLPFENKGVLRPLSKWSGMSKYTVSFGQELSVTALQLTGAYSAIANGGRLMEPRIVSAVVDDQGEVLWKNPPAEVRRVVSEATAATITRALTMAVQKGTGVNAKIQWDPSTLVAGKTGTAQKFDRVKKRYSDTLTLVSFCGFFPADKPKYVIAVFLDEPEGRRWGGLDAAPVFRRIAEQLSPKLIAERSAQGSRAG